MLREHEPATHSEMLYLLQRPLFRRDGLQFKFSHTLYQEFLTADALAELSLRKQRQLLRANLTGTERVCTPYRGIASFLAEQSPQHLEHLLINDPLVSFFAEVPSLSPNREEALLRTVFDTEIAQQHAPWFEIPPSGARPDSVLSKHRPNDIHLFLLPYLETASEFSRLWATCAAHEWGGHVRLNPPLGKLAQDSSQHTHVRCWAIQAVGHTRDLDAIRALYNLHDDADDQVRGYAIQVYRTTEKPSPGELIGKIQGRRAPAQLLRHPKARGEKLRARTKRRGTKDVLLSRREGFLWLRRPARPDLGWPAGASRRTPLPGSTSRKNR